MTGSTISVAVPGNLHAFKDIIAELISLFPDFPNLEGRRILELGPGGKLDLLIYLEKYSRSAFAQGVGRSAGSWWPGKKSRAGTGLVVDDYILPYLQRLPTESLDIILSRQVLELHSINARILLAEPSFKRAVEQL